LGPAHNSSPIPARNWPSTLAKSPSHTCLHHTRLKLTAPLSRLLLQDPKPPSPPLVLPTTPCAPYPLTATTEGVSKTHSLFMKPTLFCSSPHTPPLLPIMQSAIEPSRTAACTQGRSLAPLPRRRSVFSSTSGVAGHHEPATATTTRSVHRRAPHRC
jgi:hypothetical protein